MVASRSIELFPSPIHGDRSPLPSDHLRAFQELLELVTSCIEAHHKHLLAIYRRDILRKSKILGLYLRAKKQGEHTRIENYLLTFIKTFGHDISMNADVTLCRQLLAALQQTKTVMHELQTNVRQAPRHSLTELVDITETALQGNPAFSQSWIAKFKSLSTTPVATTQETATNNKTTNPLNPQQQAFQELQTTFIVCIQHRMPSPYPSPNKYYDLAKLKILWENYTAQYGNINESDLTTVAIQTIIEAQRQAVIAKQVEAQQALASQREEHSPLAFKRQQKELQDHRDQALHKIEASHERLNRTASVVIGTAKDLTSVAAKRTFDRAIRTVEHKALSIAGSPGLFNFCTGSKQPKPHARQALAKIEELRRMQAFANLFRDEKIKAAHTPQSTTSSFCA